MYELCVRGFQVEGNEISYHQLMASNFILNHVHRQGQFEVFPWCGEFSNLRERGRQVVGVAVPDVCPAVVMGAGGQGGGRVGEGKGEEEEGGRGSMSMTGGDFLLLYGKEEYQGVFDAVATVFFVDTAPDVIRYVETVRGCLREGGWWVNNGPLLWHFDDRGPGGERSRQGKGEGKGGENGQGAGKGEGKERGQWREGKEEDAGIGEPGSFELTDEEMVLLVQTMGFEIVRHEVGGEEGYIRDKESLLQHLYRTSFWIARKKGDVEV